MIVSGVVAVALCAVQLGPIVMGKPLVEPPSTGAKKGGGAKPQAGKPAHPPPPPKAKARPKAASGTRQRAGPVASTPPPELPPLKVDSLDEALLAPLRFVLNWKELRDPFGPADFETVVPTEMQAAAKLRLQGVLRSDQARLAILGNRVYREGQEVLQGVRLVTIEDTAVVLSDGVREVRLSLGSGLRLEKP